MYAGDGACRQGIILNTISINVTFMIAPLTGTYRALKQIQMAAQLPTIIPDTGMFNP
jgi:hypothetical protein